MTYNHKILVCQFCATFSMIEYIDGLSKDIYTVCITGKFGRFIVTMFWQGKLGEWINTVKK